MRSASPAIRHVGAQSMFAESRHCFSFRRRFGAHVVAYELHIERLPLTDEGERTPISSDEWKAALSATEGVRLCPPGAHTITNPKTGEVISIPRRDGDAEVYFS